MSYSTHTKLYYGIKVNHLEAKKIEEFFASFAKFDEDEDEEDRNEFALYNGFLNCDLQSFSLVGQNADGRIQNLEGYIDTYQNEIPYYAFGVFVAKRKTKLSVDELQDKEQIIYEKWQKVIRYLDRLGLKNNPEYLIINQVV